MTRLLVVGGASFDVLQLEDRTVESVGGAGMYTAMAARRCGAQVAMFYLRPDPCPERLQPVAARLTEWLGPVVSPAQLPHFEISYRGGKPEYIKMSLGAVAMLSPTMLPADLSKYDLVHVGPKGDATKQLSFIQACRQRGAKQISAGTGLFIVDKQPQAVRAVMEQTDYFHVDSGGFSHRSGSNRRGRYFLRRNVGLSAAKETSHHGSPPRRSAGGGDDRTCWSDRAFV